MLDFLVPSGGKKISIKWHYAAFVPIFKIFRMFKTYILCSQKNGSYYIGSCSDIEKRVAQHNKGSVKATKRYLPWEVVYMEEFDDLKDARKREFQMKSWKKRAAIKYLIEHSKNL